MPWLKWGERGPRAAPFGRKVVDAFFPSRHREVLLYGVLDHGLLWGGCPVYWGARPARGVPPGLVAMMSIGRSVIPRSEK
jgi:hypothetical protein